MQYSSPEPAAGHPEYLIFFFNGYAKAKAVSNLMLSEELAQEYKTRQELNRMKSTDQVTSIKGESKKKVRLI